MDLQIVKKGVMDYTTRKRKLLLLLATLGFTGYGVYKVYHLPSVAHKRQLLLKLCGALLAITEAVSDSAEAIGVVSRDLKHFLQSDSDEIPNSLKQISKIAKSDELCTSVAKLTQALTVGILRSHSRASGYVDGGSSFTEKVMDKMFTDAGSGFASVVAGSFARNLVMAFYTDDGEPINNLGSEVNHVPRWVNVVCTDQGRELIGGWIQLFASTAVAVYLDKTMNVNTYDQFFSGMTNPKHSSEVRDMMVSVCNGAVHTLVNTSHQVLTTPTTPDSDSKSAAPSSQGEGNVNVNVEEAVFSELKARKMVEGEMRDYRWDGSVSSTLAVPSNRRFILDVAGRVAFQTVRSFLQFLFDKVYEGMRTCVDMVYEAAMGGPCQLYRYLYTKSSVATLCLS